MGEAGARVYVSRRGKHSSKAESRGVSLRTSNIRALKNSQRNVSVYMGSHTLDACAINDDVKGNLKYERASAV